MSGCTWAIRAVARWRTTGTTTELPNWRYACVSETGIRNRSCGRASSSSVGSTWCGFGNPIRRAHSTGVSRRGIAPSGVDEDLRAVLVITGTEGPRDVVAASEAEPEPVSRLAVLLGVGLQVFPKVRRQYVLAIDPRLEDVPQDRSTGGRNRREHEPLAAEDIAPQADHERSLPVLRNP